MVRAFRRRFQGGNNSTIPSRFLNDLPENITINPARSTRNSETVWKPGTTPIAENIPSNHNRKSFKVGDKVLHAKFGQGLVITAEASRDDYEVTVAFKDGSGIKRLLLSYAPLEHITDEPGKHDTPQEDESS
jgi:DNA helicase-2/ATP-dependent DNA helicase PcrA